MGRRGLDGMGSGIGEVRRRRKEGWSVVDWWKKIELIIEIVEEVGMFDKDCELEYQIGVGEGF